MPMIIKLHRKNLSSVDCEIDVAFVRFRELDELVDWKSLMNPLLLCLAFTFSALR